MPQEIQSKSIYHGLPIFPDDTEGLTAIVTGSNGISGAYQLKVLCESPRRWKKIYALSRRPPHGSWPGNVEHLSVDLLQPPEQVAAQLAERNIRADYVFFFAYIQPVPRDGGGIWSAEDEMVRLNKHLLSNFLEGLELNNTIPKRVLLQLGAKYYGLHHGPGIPPQEESDPRILIGPNFYYDQEDYLRSFTKKHQIGWNTTRPSHIAGAVPDAAMNLCYPLAVYATIQKYLNKPLEYPGDLIAWESHTTISTAQANAYLAEWAVLTKQAENESFNASDDCLFTWAKFWPQLAKRFKMPWTGPDTSDDAQYRTITSPAPPPRGYGPPGRSRYRFTLAEWAKKPEIQKAWSEVSERHDLREKKFREIDRIFGFTDLAITAGQSIMLSTTKAKKMGYFGFVDSVESMLRVVEEFAEMGMIPELP
ncbi:hypothetical protein N7510_006153 [Penicillium lagena]|uniref:uncharacterized protein n=1 Tax=Penicillium lagena TaxID=94218 RepID=UPI0025408DEC|nr:uncharacterized protein N7510_006153 [Penicillium lagena]KAJ5612959.1 hypothetical protein N7510_006153 [Penicillium lagena]